MKIVCRAMGVPIHESQVVPWGDFVEPSTQPTKRQLPGDKFRVLWVGRLLNWKRVDTIICAVGELAKGRSSSMAITLDIYGAGPEEARLKGLAAKYGDAVAFHPPVTMADVRELMRRHDVYVLASNLCEGWGAVVPEALEEGMLVLGTYEAGASAALLPQENLFHSGDWKGLAKKLSEISKVRRVRLPEEFTPAGAAMRLLSIAAGGGAGARARNLTSA